MVLAGHSLVGESCSSTSGVLSVPMLGVARIAGPNLMNATVRRFFQGIPVFRDLYAKTRKAYRRRQIARAAKTYFVNFDDYREALDTEDGRTSEIRTHDGLIIALRRNYTDAAILAEIFVENCYIQGLSLPPRPVVIDVGGYIGDFALYAAKHLNALKVVVCEPSPHNWALLENNVARNNYQDRIEIVNKAVTSGGDVMMDVDAPQRGQAMVSAYGSATAVRKLVRGVTLADLMEQHKLDVVDLLKMDCEGGEYSILSNTPTETFRCIRNIVFEYHEIDGFESKLKAVSQRLRDHQYSLTRRGSLIFASRP